MARRGSLNPHHVPRTEFGARPAWVLGPRPGKQSAALGPLPPGDRWTDRPEQPDREPGHPRRIDRAERPLLVPPDRPPAISLGGLQLAGPAPVGPAAPLLDDRDHR